MRGGDGDGATEWKGDGAEGQRRRSKGVTVTEREGRRGNETESNGR